jgi:hypothetical protein
MPQRKKKPDSGAKADAQRGGQPSLFQEAFTAWLRGERTLLLQLLELHESQIPPQLHDILYDIVEHASMPAPPMPKREPGRPKDTTRYHTDIQRAEIVRTVDWLRKIKPSMTETHARELVADRYGISPSSVKQYCLNQPRHLR